MATLATFHLCSWNSVADQRMVCGFFPHPLRFLFTTSVPSRPSARLLGRGAACRGYESSVPWCFFSSTRGDMTPRVLAIFVYIFSGAAPPEHWINLNQRLFWIYVFVLRAPAFFDLRTFEKLVPERMAEFQSWGPIRCHKPSAFYLPRLVIHIHIPLILVGIGIGISKNWILNGKQREQWSWYWLGLERDSTTSYWWIHGYFIGHWLAIEALRWIVPYDRLA